MFHSGRAVETCRLQHLRRHFGACHQASSTGQQAARGLQERGRKRAKERVINTAQMAASLADAYLCELNGSRTPRQGYHSDRSRGPRPSCPVGRAAVRLPTAICSGRREMSGAIRFHTPDPGSDINRREGTDTASAEIMAEWRPGQARASHSQGKARGWCSLRLSLTR